MISFPSIIGLGRVTNGKAARLRRGPIPPSERRTPCRDSVSWREPSHSPPESGDVFATSCAESAPPANLQFLPRGDRARRQRHQEPNPQQPPGVRPHRESGIGAQLSACLFLSLAPPFSHRHIRRLQPVAATAPRVRNRTPAASATAGSSITHTATRRMLSGSTSAPRRPVKTGSTWLLCRTAKSSQRGRVPTTRCRGWNGGVAINSGSISSRSRRRNQAS